VKRRTCDPLSDFRYLNRALENNEHFSPEYYNKCDVDKLTSLVGEDGTLLLKMMAANSNDLLISDVVFYMLELQRRAQTSYPGPSVIVTPSGTVNVPLLPASPEANKID